MGASIVIALVKIGAFLFFGLQQIFKYLIYKPGYIVLRFVFYNIVVKVYQFYVRMGKRFGFARHMSLPAVLQQKLIHFLVIGLTVSLIFVNITQDSHAGTLTENAGKTILSGLIKGEFSGIEEDEQLVIETFDRELIISQAQQTYLDNLSSFRPAQNFNPEIEETIAAADSNSALRQPEITTTEISLKPRTEIVEHVIQTGESVSTIAESYGISVSTILWENNLSAYSIIRPGDKLRILPVSGLVHKVVSGDTLGAIAQKYKIEEDIILKNNKIETGNRLSIGQELVIPGASKSTYVAPQPKTYTGFSAIKTIVAPVEPESVPANKMYWPAQGRITQYYSWNHAGLDLANKTGTAVHSADAGTVELAGWGKGYGNQILVDHGGGKKTRYAHLSKFYVEAGDKVDRGEVIAAMGSTGWSTGPHLHFEIIINNKKYNPLNYIK